MIISLQDATLSTPPLRQSTSRRSFVAFVVVVHIQNCVVIIVIDAERCLYFHCKIKQLNSTQSVHIMCVMHLSIARQPSSCCICGQFERLESHLPHMLEWNMLDDD